MSLCPRVDAEREEGQNEAAARIEHSEHCLDYFVLGSDQEPLCREGYAPPFNSTVV